ncbi:MAG: preprotein translocase subunit SecE [Marinomonas sp.]|jgi:preprotein translocase subunit SecE|uniref:Protein translocase subunit SecE n=3 Tax=Marinomonas TaxID=28253 RepID=A0A366IY52_9GAMM|nr:MULTISPECIES: preprotein translocase subunit SecE [Marinomonas]MBU0791669.1 preprotein translocase subunit SecE [Gammaproteobacteria bacterium]MBU1294413.1 preprotein translocase subunit SecE [Gammaproteobacteria bacterium]MBU1466161.1 preprotein translocase subunit SecE [Gammaproteobacteria bacterium]MBU2023903.1 preprotein translocase subunit SecE [Gammaproteobacteria bacterium]MBU2238780.1 preprotein translocase subunit SecE [Gammaproteobacteria bacterium]|tara:strand:- start:56670 stop:57038 length:369 start_codon:yes stop_codon:yes gene_type:complete
MSSSTEAQASRGDVFKWAIVVLLVAVGVIGNNYYSAESLLYRLIAILVLAGVAGFVALQTVKGKAFFTLAKEAKTEIRRVVWPTRQETMQTTLIVLAVVVFMSLVLWGVDSFLGWIVSSVIS